MMGTTEISKRDKRLQKNLELIDDAKSSMIADAITIGTALLDIKECLDHGQFLPYVAEHCWFDARTAQRYMDASRAFAKYDRVSYFDGPAIYLLARCEPAAEAAKKLADKGFRVSTEKAKELIEDAKAEKSQPEHRAGSDSRRASGPVEPEGDVDVSGDSDGGDACAADDDEPELGAGAVEASEEEAPDFEVAPAKTQPEKVRPFATLPSLPADVDDAYESFKLCILRHKIGGWQEISARDVVEALDALKQMALAPAE